MKVTVKNVGNLDENNNIMVTECTLIILGTDDYMEPGTWYLTPPSCTTILTKRFRPILISEIELMESGELYLSSIKRDIKPKREGVIPAGDKILAMPEQFSPLSIELIVKGVIKGGDTLLLECEGDHVPHEKCISTGVCQETEGFKGTEHEGVDMCEDGCVQGKAERWVKLDKNGHIHFFHPIEPVSGSDKLKEFYEWYSEANAATRGQVLNELQRRLGLPVEKYPSPEYRYSEAFVLWYSGMKPEQIHAAYRRYNREVADKMQRDLTQGILELKAKPKPKPGELEL